jgi:A/G-specific adenine glycosylase
MVSTTERIAIHRALLRWYARHGRDLPWRETADPYAIFVSEVMLQQTQVTTVLPFYHAWMKRFPNFSALAAASETDVLHAWQGLGYYTRARNLHSAAKQVVAVHRGVLPQDPLMIRTLPGMGRYTSNAVATFAFDQSVPIVEANITRLLARLFNIAIAVDSAIGRERLWTAATALVPDSHAARFNSALMDLGATVCVSRKPKCERCPVQSLCKAPAPELLPVKKPRPPTVHLNESHLFVRRGNNLLLEHCSDRWRGMWMLPSLTAFACTADKAIHSAVFPFTHHQITLRVFRPNRAPHRRAGTKWVAIDQLKSLPIPSPHRRSIDACLQLGVGH